MISKFLNARGYLPFWMLRRNQSTSTPPETRINVRALWEKQKEVLLMQEQEVLKMYRFMVERNDTLSDADKAHLNQKLEEVRRSVDAAVGRRRSSREDIW